MWEVLDRGEGPESALCPRGSSLALGSGPSVGLSLFHKDDNPGRHFTPSSLNYLICKRGRNTQTCLPCGRALGRAIESVHIGNKSFMAGRTGITSLEKISLWVSLPDILSDGPVCLSRLVKSV